MRSRRQWNGGLCRQHRRTTRSAAIANKPRDSCIFFLELAWLCAVPRRSFKVEWCFSRVCLEMWRNPNPARTNRTRTQVSPKTERERKRRNSAIADNPARRIYRSVKVTKHSTIPYVRYSFLLCNSNFVFKIFTIFDFKNAVNLKSGSEIIQCHWMWYHSIDLVWFPISVL